MAIPSNNVPLTTQETRDEIDRRTGGTVTPNQRDPGFGQLDLPLIGSDLRSKLVLRDIPIITLTNTWTPPQVRSALQGHILGVFELSGQMVDAIIADDRVTATLNSRLSGLFGREVRFEGAQGRAKGSRAAKEALDAWQDNWDYFTADGCLYQIGAYQNLFGVWASTLVWNTTKPIAQVRLDPWHMRYTYYNWDVRKYIALSQDGQLPIYPGDGKWFLHAPRGSYRAWMWGTIRAIALPWLLRQYALRDMANFSEVYGSPTRVGWTPAAADPTERDLFASQLSQLASNTTLLLPRGVDKDMGYGYELVSVNSSDWTIFPGLSDRCDMHITLAILMQNLTTEVKGGSFAATESHMDIMQSGVEADNQAWKAGLHSQVARPFTYLNFGDAELAPWTCWDVTSRNEQTERATRFYSFGQSVQILRQGGVQFPNADDLKEFALNQFGVRLPNTVEIGEPDNGAGTGAGNAQDSANDKIMKGK